MSDTSATPSRRPRLPINQDNEFWIEGVNEQRLLAQRCRNCGLLRHPPAPMCAACQSLEWDAERLSGRGSVYSYVIHHKPPLPGFEPPYAILLVETEEGTRVIGNLVEAPLGALRIGLPVEVVFRAGSGDDYVLPQWRPSRSGE